MRRGNGRGRRSQGSGTRNQESGVRGRIVGRPIRNPQSAIRNKRGIGFAAGFKNVGFSFGYQENSYARVELRGGAEIAEAAVYFAGADCGQGNHTIIAQVAAEVAGVPFERVKVIASDTSLMGERRQRVGLAAHLHVGQRRQGRGREGAGGLAERGAAGRGRARLPGAQDHQARPRDGPGHAELRLRLRGAGRAGRRGHRDRPGQGRTLHQRRRRGPGHQPAAGDGPDRGRGRAGVGLRSAGGVGRPRAAACSPTSSAPT